MATDFFGGAYFGGDYFDSAPPPPVVVIDTHDGDLRLRKEREEFRAAQARRRQQLTDAFASPEAAGNNAAQVSLDLAAGAAPGLPQIEQFDFDADDEEIILLI